MNIPESCTGKVKPIAELIGYWIWIREWKRVRENAAAVIAWDKMLREVMAASPDGNVTDEQEGKLLSVVSSEAKVFGEQIEDALVSSTTLLPGFDVASCRFTSWGSMACMAYSFAKLDEPERSKGLELYKQGVQNWSCPSEIMNSQDYAGDYPSPGSLSTGETKTNWKPWAIGGAVVVGLGIIGYVLLSENSADKEALRKLRSTQNPGRTYKEVRAEAQREADEFGYDYGIERNAFGFTHFMLPRRENRFGHELRCEVVHPTKGAKPGHGMV
jgi:hypothetical protein